MLGDLLGVGEQFAGVLRVLLGARAARTRSGQRADRHFLAFGGGFLANQDFGRSADHLEIVEVVVIHVRRRIERAQRAVQGERRLRERQLDALADLHLHHVAVGDVLLGARHRRQVVVLGEVADRRAGGRRPAFGNFERTAQARRQFMQSRLTARVGVGRRRVDIDDQVDLARQAVDDRQLLGLQQQDVGHVNVVGLAELGELGFDITHRLVTEVTGEAAAEARESRRHIDLEARLVSGEKVERIAVKALDDLAVADDLARKFARSQQSARRQADERIAAETLAADDRFEQEAIGRVGELEVDRQRGVEIGEGFEGDRDTVITLRSKAVENGFRHERLHKRWLHGPARRAGARKKLKRGLLAGTPGPSLRPKRGLAMLFVVKCAHSLRDVTRCVISWAAWSTVGTIASPASSCTSRPSL